MKMTDVLLEPEDMATVAEALAFIDACEGSASPSTNCSTSGSDSAASPLSDSQSLTLAIDLPSFKAVKTESEASVEEYSGVFDAPAAPQESRDAAAARGGLGVGALAAHVAQLKKTADCKWMELTMIELQRRQSVKYTNRKLRTLLANQARVDEALRGVVMNKSVLQGMDFLDAKPPTSQGPLAAVDNSSVIMAQLAKKVSEMYLKSATLFETETETPTLKCEMQHRVDPQLGLTVEIVSSAPLSCSIEAATPLAGLYRHVRRSSLSCPRWRRVMPAVAKKLHPIFR
ncbi:uncharacterized protein PITG_09158 [Phytophthora infestans T30-4]|uniref:Uncharacterized protein n=1 Tax=Phytophthora infestans (strain T30-4) TaxID=403677 RepID=D0NBU4_PHYIT|nr:uncharacterized protein PITG_09158 [Phytophthora infestans T30-4]EEY55249.1 conserved hypothetical protein [Phytophthora infestans T30-4]|eukprot:XP_002903473.1 conserved hypothetical protein [Phytophthora infestans T30-4]